MAVSSCKGGVGKSTIAVQLARAFSKSGLKVGIFDADIYGPSLPVLMPVDGVPDSEDGLLLPLEKEGIKLMSFGYVQDEKAPAAMRGAMVTQVVTQLVSGTQWGDLDVLVIDFPPGTGDIQLTLGQLIPISAALIVTTPQALSFVDVEKGIMLFDKLRIPTIAVIENMSYFLCDDCDKKHNVFGEGAKKRLIDEYGFQKSFELPIHQALSTVSDAGECLDNPDLLGVFMDLAQFTLKELDRLASTIPPHVECSSETILYQEPECEPVSIHPKQLRLQCQCARCRDEFTGELLLSEGDISDDIHVTSSHQVGNYALGIQWSDGHQSIYPYALLKKLPELSLS
ncbi:hypothetical protein DID77_04095 [Candidatus Marinamargulisbacteria bacterium SCGC AG-439-L15]|nr:hypothetical protein DID77_04095 [Candidatus Marinamargulisbacteria bacterium SCGC AG-439-L15]